MKGPQARLDTPSERQSRNQGGYASATPSKTHPPTHLTRQYPSLRKKNNRDLAWISRRCFPNNGLLFSSQTAFRHRKAVRGSVFRRTVTERYSVRLKSSRGEKKGGTDPQSLALSYKAFALRNATAASLQIPTVRHSDGSGTLAIKLSAQGQ